MQLKRTAAEANVAWPHKETSVVGVNHLRLNSEPALKFNLKIYGKINKNLRSNYTKEEKEKNKTSLILSS